MPRTPSAPPRALGVALLFAAWLLFFVLLNALGAALAPATAPRPFEFGPSEIVAATLWTVLSLVIAGYHRFLRRRLPNLVALIAAHLPVLLLASVVDAAVTIWGARTFGAAPPKVNVIGLAIFYLDFDLVSYVGTVIVSEILFVRRALRDRQQQAERLERSLTRARLDYLEAQLQPHFLFNSLGAVSELAFDSPPTAARILRQLASIFRTALAHKTDEITLGDEIVGIEPYLDIQRLRFADWLTIEYAIDETTVDCLVPRFVLQPLIENAIRHGLSGRRAPGMIEISARLADGMLVLRVADNGVGLDGSRSVAGRGIGLSNVRDRLRILYGDDESLRLASNDHGGAVAELRFPARRRGDAAAPVEGTDRGDARIVERLRPLTVPALFRRRGIAIATVWIVAGLMWTQQSFLYLTIRNRLEGATWWTLAFNDMLSAGIWALLTPVILRFAARLPLRRAGIGWRLAAYATVAVGMVLVHNLLWWRVILPGRSLFTPQSQMSFAVGFLIVCALMALGHRDSLRDWLRDREERASALRAELDEARRRAVELQEIPPVLLHSLEGIAGTAQHDPTLTERQLTRLADYVRLALECTDADGITPERERALAASLAELRTIGAYTLTLSA